MLPSASRASRRGPVTGANIGMRFFAVAGSKMMGARASDRPADISADWPGTWTGLPDEVGERAMNRT